MALMSAFAEAFLVSSCECCGKVFGGRYVYRDGLRQCADCAAGDHRHPMPRDRAA